jgi:hypothetical protein
MCLTVVAYGQKEKLALFKSNSKLNEIELETAETGII